MSEPHNRISQHLNAHTCGHCGECRWWQADANAAAYHDTVGLCLHEELAHFELGVSIDSGCNRFAAAPTAALPRSPT